MLVWPRRPVQYAPAPQENFGRELMSCSAWAGLLHGVRRLRGRARFHRLESQAHDRRQWRPYPKYEFAYNAASHDASAKTFTFPILPGRGAPRFPRARRRRDAGRHRPHHGVVSFRQRRGASSRAVELLREPSSTRRRGVVDELAGVYLSSGYNLRHVVGRLLRSGRLQSVETETILKFIDASTSWPADLDSRGASGGRSCGRGLTLVKPTRSPDGEHGPGASPSRRRRGMEQARWNRPAASGPR